MNETLEERLGIRLARSGGTLAVAESCTGGLLGGRITSVAGSSAWFQGGIIAYSNAVKASLLRVPTDVLDRAGAVSAEVACAMAHGVRHALQTVWGLSVTGVAGPDGGTDAKPVGLVFIGFASAAQAHAERNVFHGDRAAVREQSCARALELMLKQIEEAPQD